MRLGLIADVHFGPPTGFDGKLRKHGDLAAELTREFVARMNGVKKPDLAINLGNVVEEPQFEVDERLRASAPPPLR
jgi:3',5'-cyclic AMP phosphodiesterase CpdA